MRLITPRLLPRPRPHHTALSLRRAYAPKMSTQTASTEQNSVNTTAPTNPKTDPSAPAAAPSKKIFAPTSDPTKQQADQYTKGALDRPDLSPDPLDQFDTWFKLAQSEKVFQPETVNLSTCSLPSGRVSSRYVYLKELDSRGFVIYSNFGTSRKAADLASNPFAALSFWWREQERQVRVEGRTERLSREESQVYFDTRIRGSRIGAWASRQSQVIGDRGELEGWVKDEEKRWEGEDRIECPDFWGGLRVVPEMVEFWQGRESRLHDRFRYTREGEGGEWKVERLSP